jgi:hypothetical protein
MLYDGDTKIEKILETLALVIASDASDVVIDLSTEWIIYIRVVSLFLKIPIGGSLIL